MARKSVDIFISGGGIAGLVAAAAMAQQGFSVLLADPAVPPNASDAARSDLRSTAFLAPARLLLKNAGVWTDLAAHACPLETLRVIDCAGDPPEPTTARAFEAHDLNEPAFGWNVPNWRARKALSDRLADDSAVGLRFGTGFAGLLARDAEALVSLSDGTQLRAKLVVGADGRNSPVRAASGIGVSTTRYGQKAFAAIVTHEVPHGNASNELYLSGGAFTLVPLTDFEGHPASALVWMVDGRDARALSAMSEDAFACAATERSCGVLGMLRLVSERRLWPVVTQSADRLTATRTALIAEAAHVLPPIGAQGLNTSLHDVATLAELSANRPEGIGDPAFLAAYETARQRDIRLRIRAIDLYNRICRSDAPPAHLLRSLGLRLTHDVEPLRRTVMKAGMGK